MRESMIFYLSSSSIIFEYIVRINKFEQTRSDLQQLLFDAIHNNEIEMEEWKRQSSASATER
jgi:hypothetical protein